MKKLLLLACFIMGISSCAKHNEAGVNTPEAKLELSPEESRALLYSSGGEKVSYQQAEAFATNAMRMLDQNNVTGTRVSRTLGAVAPVIGTTEIKTRSGETKTVTDTTMYIFNFSGDNGYALISTNGLTQNIVAIVEKGTLNSLDDVAKGELPQLQSALMAHEAEQKTMLQNLDSLTNSAEAKLAKLDFNSSPSSRAIDVVSVSDYDHKIATTVTDNGYRKVYLPWDIHSTQHSINSMWGLQGDFTAKCPNASCGHKCSVGSVAPAIAQLAFHKRIKNSQFIWADDMVNYFGFDIGAIVNKESQLTIQSLYKYIVENTIAVQDRRCMEPGCPNFGVSVANRDQVAICMRNMGFTGITQVQMNADTRPALAKVVLDNPVLMTAVRRNVLTNYFWIADGHVNLSRTILITDINSGASISMVDGPYKSELMHYNVGCDGYYNGYYKSWALNLAEPIQLDSSNKPEAGNIKYPNGTENYLDAFYYIQTN